MRRFGWEGGGGGAVASDFNSDTLGVGFYDDVPDYEVRIPEFEAAAKSRLKAFHVLERNSDPTKPVGRDMDPGKMLQENISSVLTSWGTPAGLIIVVSSADAQYSCCRIISLKQCHGDRFYLEVDVLVVMLMTHRLVDHSSS